MRRDMHGDLSVSVAEGVAADRGAEKLLRRSLDDFGWIIATDLR